jgi:hypothetical protein
MLSWDYPDKGTFKFVAVTYTFAVAVVALIPVIVFVLLWDPDYRERNIENARKECIAGGGQFGIMEVSRWVCLEPRT